MLVSGQLRKDLILLQKDFVLWIRWILS
jgi:hypothetical protein